MIADFLNWIKSFFIGLFNRGAQLLGNLFQSVIDVLKVILQPVFVVIALIFYVLYKVGELLVTLLQVFLALGKLILAFIKGIIATLAGFTYQPTPQSHGQWSAVFGHVVQGLDSYQISTLSYILMFCIWFLTAFAAIKILGSVRGG